jgi:hypothetical protein
MPLCYPQKFSDEKAKTLISTYGTMDSKRNGLSARVQAGGSSKSCFLLPRDLGPVLVLDGGVERVEQIGGRSRAFPDSNPLEG